MNFLQIVVIIGAFLAEFSNAYVRTRRATAEEVCNEYQYILCQAEFKI